MKYDCFFPFLICDLIVFESFPVNLLKIIYFFKQFQKEWILHSLATIFLIKRKLNMLLLTLDSF